MNTPAKIFLQTLSIIIIGLVSMWAASLFVNDEVEPPNQPIGSTTTVPVKPSDFPDFDLLNSMKNISVVTDTESSASTTPAQEIRNRLEIAGNFSRVYLYVEVSVNSKPLTDWDSIYVDLNSSFFGYDGLGGHLFRPNSLPAPKNDNVTRLLFNGYGIPYIKLPYASSKSPSTSDWITNVFNQSTETRVIRMDSYISTTQEGTIHLIALYYSCAEFTPDCYIKVLDK